jgi:hypothetical protein
VLAGEQGDPGVLRAGYLSGGRRHDALQERLDREVRLHLPGQLAQLARDPVLGALAGAADRLPRGATPSTLLLRSS